MAESVNCYQRALDSIVKHRGVAVILDSTSDLGLGLDPLILVDFKYVSVRSLRNGTPLENGLTRLFSRGGD